MKDESKKKRKKKKKETHSSIKKKSLFFSTATQTNCFFSDCLCYSLRSLTYFIFFGYQVRLSFSFTRLSFDKMKRMRPFVPFNHQLSLTQGPLQRDLHVSIEFESAWKCTRKITKKKNEKKEWDRFVRRQFKAKEKNDNRSIKLISQNGNTYR